MCKAIREGDEMACSCGLRWDIDEADPHDEAVNLVSHPAGLAKRTGIQFIGIDLAHPEGDRTLVNGHELYKDSDFTNDEVVRRNKLAEMVVEGGLSVCRKCGEFESGLDEWCKK